MGQDKLGGKTIIGMTAPVIPRSRPPVATPPQPMPPPADPSAAPQPPASTQHPAVTPQPAGPRTGPQEPTISPATPQPTVGMRPQHVAPQGHPSSPGIPPGHPSSPGMPPGYPSSPGIPPGYPSSPGMQPGYPSSPGMQPGYPSSPGIPPGHPSSPGIPPGYPSSPGAQPGYPSSPGFHTGAGAGFPAAADPDLLVGQELGGYTIKRKLAEGGMGVVFEGEHGKIGRRGAIKVLKLEFCRAEDVVERFRQEARAVNAIRHENIVDIYDFGRDPYGRVFFVMEFLEGEPLSSRIRRGALPWSEAFPVLEQTLRALKAAHDKGFVHRDLKPDNIWLKYVDGRIQVKLLDFGIAKLVGSESPREKLTQTGSVIGTPHYMSPEQINGSRDVDHRTDIYAMGVITYEMFAGVTPFVGDTLQAIMTGHLFREAPRLAEIPANLGVPGPIAEIVDRMLVKDAAGRYDSVTDVLADLHDVNAHRRPTKAETLSRERPTRMSAPLPGAPLIAVPAPGAPAAAPRGKSKRTAVIVGALAAAGIGIGAFASWKARSSDEAPAKVVQPEPPEPPPPPPPPGPQKVIDYDATRKDAFATLRASLRQAEPTARAAGSVELGKHKDQESVPKLSELAEKDEDDAVRGHAGEALGVIGADAARPLLAKIEAAAPPPLKVWYASALARLGDKQAHGRLLAYAHSKDLGVALKAALALADVSKPGDRQAIKALRSLVAQGTKLHDVAPNAEAMLLSRMAGLRDADARKDLYAGLDHANEGVRLAAAEALAKVGDDAGKKVLQEVLANQSSPNRLSAAVALIALGEYGGFDQIDAALRAKDPDARRLAARALGEIGDPKALEGLIAMAGDPDWRLRVAAASAIVSIVGLDPQVLARASVDWTKTAIASEDWATRRAAAGVLADLPEAEALPMLANATRDPKPEVRLAAARSAARMKSPKAAEAVAAQALQEEKPEVQEQQVKALGEIGSPLPAVKEALTKIMTEKPGRVGVLAAGSLIAVGDPSAKAKLDEAAAAPQPGLRVAAMEAASAAKNPIVVPTLEKGVTDKVFDVQLAAAEGLATFNVKSAAAVAMLQKAVGQLKDAGLLSRVTTTLVKFGEAVPDKAPSPAQMIDSADPKQRLAAVPIVRALPADQGVPLLRRLVADPDQEVRRAGVEAIESVVAKDKPEAIKLYKPLVNDADPVVRSKASGQLSKLDPLPKPAPQQTAAAPPAPAPDPTPAPPAPAPVSPEVKQAAEQAAAAAAAVKPATEALEALAKELAATISSTKQDHGEATIKRAEEIAAGLGEKAGELEAAAAKAEAAAKAASDAAGASPAPDAAKLVEEAKAHAASARSAATDARARAADAAKQTEEYKKKWTGDSRLLITRAETALDAGNPAAAKQYLDQAVKSKQRHANIDSLYGRVYDGMAQDAQDPAKRAQLLRKAAEHYRRFAKSGTGRWRQHASERLTLIDAELAKLPQ